MGGKSIREKKHTGLHFTVVVLADVLLIGLILLVFMAFQLKQSDQAAEQPLPAATAFAPVAASPTPETEKEQHAPEDTRTEWQKRFAEHFTEEVIRTDNSYTSPNVSITVESRTIEEGDTKSVYHVADIYIASPENFRTYTANNELRYHSVQDALEMDIAAGALVAINGDFYAYQGSGFIVRNGAVYQKGYADCDICVMYNDGSIEMYYPDSYDMDEILARGAAQVWNFGPSLLEDGHVRDNYGKASIIINYKNPRSALGYYEPGHYCFVVVDGRQNGYSRGVSLSQLARIFEDLGCVSAYNMDGGGSAVMTFDHQRYSSQSNGASRGLSDLLVIVETEGVE